jgi:hypothetical protein
MGHRANSDPFPIGGSDICAAYKKEGIAMSFCCFRLSAPLKGAAVGVQRCHHAWQLQQRNIQWQLGLSRKCIRCSTDFGKLQ